MTLCDVVNQNSCHTKNVVSPSNIICNLILRKADVFFKIVQEREDDLIISKHVAQLYSCLIMTVTLRSILICLFIRTEKLEIPKLGMEINRNCTYKMCTTIALVC